MPLLEQCRERYLRSPRLVAVDDGAWLYVRAWESDGVQPGAPGERLLAWRLDSRGTPVEGPVEASDVTGVEHVVEGPVEASDVTGVEHVVEGPVEASDVTGVEHVTDSSDESDRCELQTRCGPWTAEVQCRGTESSVVVRGPGVPSVTIWTGAGIAAAPALASGPEGAWIAFHHDVRESSEQADVAKWICLRFVGRDGVVYEPRAPMRDCDRDRTGEDQSFEFPSLVLLENGGLVLFGRASHRFYRQDLTGAGFSERMPLGEAGWGCRGRRVSAVRLRDGGLMTARRERAGIVIERLDPTPPAGAPALKRIQPPSSASTGEVPTDIASPRSSGSSPDPARRRGYRTLFGDIHQHSAHSDGLGVPDEAYLRARYRYGDDFCALTDHESFLGKRIGPVEWRYLQDVADRYDAPGQFATLIGYEWTGRMHPGPGHKIVYWPTTGYPILSRDEFPLGADLLRKVKELGGMAAPHHTGWTGADRAAHDPDVQPFWEICSCHGCYETWGHPLGQRGALSDQVAAVLLQQGLRFGLIASSDSHGLLWHHGVARKRDPFRTGLAAVQAEECTRDAVYEALKARRCYGTSGAKIMLDLDVEGAPMGSEIEAQSEVGVRAEAFGTAPIARIELVGPNDVIAAAGRGALAHIEAELDWPYVYARVLQEDGEMAWSSPVFRTQQFL